MLLRWSNQVTPIYFIHWVLIGVGLLVVEFNSLGVWLYMGLSLLILGSSDALAMMYRRSMSRSN
jgi:hypothetical protein